MKSDLKTVFYKLETNLKNCFKEKNLKWHVLAFVLTAILVLSGFDWFYFSNTQSAAIQRILIPASLIGGVLPLILPIIFYLSGTVLKNVKAQIASFALAQAGMLGLFVSSCYKAFTGRIQPPRHVLHLIDISRNFEFGFFRHGIFWGWPSSHTTVAFALALVICVLYQKNRAVQIAALLIALYVGIGVSTNIHWFSDVVAGAIIGSVIGIIVGKSFLQHLLERAMVS